MLISIHFFVLRYLISRTWNILGDCSILLIFLALTRDFCDSISLERKQLISSFPLLLFTPVRFPSENFLSPVDLSFIAHRFDRLVSLSTKERRDLRAVNFSKNGIGQLVRVTYRIHAKNKHPRRNRAFN